MYIFTGPIAGQLEEDPANLGFHPFDDEILQSTCKRNGKRNKDATYSTYSTYIFEDDESQSKSVNETEIPCRRWITATSSKQILDLFVVVRSPLSYNMTNKMSKLDNFTMKIWSSAGKSDTNVFYDSLDDFLPKSGQVFVYDSFTLLNETMSTYYLRARFEDISPAQVYAVELSYDGYNDYKETNVEDMRRWRTNNNYGSLSALNKSPPWAIKRNVTSHHFDRMVKHEDLRKPYKDTLPDEIDKRYDFWFESTEVQSIWIDQVKENIDLRAMCNSTSISYTLQGKVS